MKNPRSTSKISNDVPFSAEQIHAFRLRRHHLLDQSAKDLVTICRDVCGVQAQIMSAAQLQLWARNHAITPAAVNDALWKTRSLVWAGMAEGQELAQVRGLCRRGAVPRRAASGCAARRCGAVGC